MLNLYLKQVKGTTVFIIFNIRWMREEGLVLFKWCFLFDFTPGNRTSGWRCRNCTRFHRLAPRNSCLENNCIICQPA